MDEDKLQQVIVFKKTFPKQANRKQKSRNNVNTQQQAAESRHVLPGVCCKQALY